jgi:hypothetical protein
MADNSVTTVLLLFNYSISPHGSSEHTQTRTQAGSMVSGL